MGEIIRCRRRNRSLLSECTGLPCEKLLGVRLTAENRTAWNREDAKYEHGVLKARRKMSSGEHREYVCKADILTRVHYRLAAVHLFLFFAKYQPWRFSGGRHSKCRNATSTNVAKSDWSMTTYHKSIRACDWLISLLGSICLLGRRMY
jgi:hypothetical protein